MQTTEQSLLADYLTQLETRGYSRQTLRSYEHDISLFCNFLRENNRSYTNLDINIARAYLVNLRHRKLSPRSIRRHISSVKNFCRFLQYHRIITGNPFSYLRMPKVLQRLPSCMTYHHIQAMISACSTDYLGCRDKALLEFLYSTGARAFETVKINISQANRRVIAIKGKGNKPRLLFVGPPAQQALQDYLALRELHIHPNDPDARQALFLNDKGRRLTTRGLYYIVKKYESYLPYGKKIGVHLFRHTFATHLLNEGADLRTVQEMLGHENLSTTQIYTRVSIEHLKQIYRNTHPHAKRLN